MRLSMVVGYSPIIRVFVVSREIFSYIRFPCGKTGHPDTFVRLVPGGYTVVSVKPSALCYGYGWRYFSLRTEKSLSNQKYPFWIDHVRLIWLGTKGAKALDRRGYWIVQTSTVCVVPVQRKIIQNPTSIAGLCLKFRFSAWCVLYNIL